MPEPSSHLGFRPIQKIATIHASSGFIRGIPILLTRLRRMNAWTAAASIMILVSGAIATSQAQQPSTTLSPAALKEIAEVEAEIDRIEAQTLERLTELPNNQVDQIELLGKLMLYDKELSVNRNQACAFCHMPETGFTGRCRSSIAPPAPIPAPCAPASAIASRRRTPTRRFRPFSITIPVRVIWSAAISGTCVQPAAGWAIQRPSRRRGRRLILSKWGCPILLVWFTEHR